MWWEEDAGETKALSQAVSLMEGRGAGRASARKCIYSENRRRRGNGEGKGILFLEENACLIIKYTGGNEQYLHVERGERHVCGRR